MTSTLITGATGFIGSHVCRMLVERGDSVVATVRASSAPEAVAALKAQGVERRTADIRDRAAVRRAMRGAEKVFHVAGHSHPSAGRQESFAIDVEGTRIVLEEALRAGVQRVVLTSSAAALGPAPKDTVADETNVWHDGHGIPHVDAKHEVEVTALRMLSRGLPVVIVNPCRVLGAGARGGGSTVFVRHFLRREIPLYVDGTINFVGVEDVARGHLAADDRGEHGERYILGNRNFTMDRLFADLARLSGVQEPQIKLPIAAAQVLVRAGLTPPVLGMRSPIILRAMGLRWAYSSAKAKRELRWETSPHEDCLEETIAYYREQEGASLSPPGARQPIELRLAGGLLRVLRIG